MHRNLIFIFLFITKLIFCQTQINWEDLEDVEFSDMYIDSIGEYVLYPHFGPNVRELHEKKVSISGYILALDPDKGYYVLSKGPFASCFFWSWRSRNSNRIKFKISERFFFYGSIYNYHRSFKFKC